MPKLEHIQDYKGYAIMIWHIPEGKLKGTRYFTVGNREHRTIRDAKKEIDKIKRG